MVFCGSDSSVQRISFSHRTIPPFRVDLSVFLSVPRRRSYRASAGYLDRHRHESLGDFGYTRDTRGVGFRGTATLASARCCSPFFIWEWTGPSECQRLLTVVGKIWQWVVSGRLRAPLATCGPIREPRVPRPRAACRAGSQLQPAPGETDTRGFAPGAPSLPVPSSLDRGGAAVRVRNRGRARAILFAEFEVNHVLRHTALAARSDTTRLEQAHCVFETGGRGVVWVRAPRPSPHPRGCPHALLPPAPARYSSGRR